MNRTDALLARANQFVRAGTAGLTSLTDNRNAGGNTRRDAKAKADEDEVEAYLKSLTLGEDNQAPKKSSSLVKANSSMPLPSSQALSGRGRSFLKPKDTASTDKKVVRTETIEVPLSTKEPIRSQSMSSSSYSSPSPPSRSPPRRPVKAVTKQSSGSDEDEEAALDNRLVAEQFRKALKTTGSLGLAGDSGSKPGVKEKPPAPPPAPHAPESEAMVISSSFVDDSGNVVYSLTFDEEEDEALPEVKDQTEVKSDAEDVDAEEYDSPFNLANVVQSVDELISGPPTGNKSATPEVPESRPGTSNSFASVVESLASRPASAASTESPKSVAGRYSDDFEESSQSTNRPKFIVELPPPPPPSRTTQPFPSARSVEAHSVTSTQNVDESIAPLSESLATDSSRPRALSYSAAQSMKLPVGKKAGSSTKTAQLVDINERASPPQQRRDAETKPGYRPRSDVHFQQPPSSAGFQQQQQQPQPQQPSFSGEATSNFFQNMFSNAGGAPVVVMFPPVSLFNQMFMPSLAPSAAATVPPAAAASQTTAPTQQLTTSQPVIAQQPPSVYLPFFLERSTTRTLVAQCRMLTESINATRMAYERRIASAGIANSLKESTKLK